jgi:hypothetical protein
MLGNVPTNRTLTADRFHAVGSTATIRVMAADRAQARRGSWSGALGSGEAMGERVSRIVRARENNFFGALR